MRDALLFVTPLVVTCFALLWVVGSLVEEIAKRCFTIEEGLAYFPPFGMFLLGLCVALGLWMGFANAALTVALWGLVVTALVLAVRRRWWSAGSATIRQLAQFRIAMCVLAYVVIQMSFIAYPDIEGLNLRRQMWRGNGLPIDCFIPYAFAEMVIARIDPNHHMIVDDWYLSDRPPLSGIVYAALRLMLAIPTYQHFVVIAVLLNSLFLFAAYLTLNRISGSDRAFRVFFLIAVASCFLSINTWFTWPKMLAASLVLLSLESIESERPPWFSGAIAGLGLLAHGQAVFVLPALVFRQMMLGKAIKPILPVRTILAFVLGSVLTYGPWLFYQRAFHPDRARLVKWHVFGQVSPTDDSLWAAALAYVTENSPSQLLAVRLTNALWPFQLEPFWEGAKLFARGDVVLAFKAWHDFAFVFLLGALNPFIVLVVCVLCVWMVRRGINPFTNLMGLLIVAVGTYVTSVMLFALEQSTVNHTWAYATVLSLLMVCALILARLPRIPLILFLIAVALFEGGASYNALRVDAMPVGWAPGWSAALFFNVALTMLAFAFNLPGRQK